MPKPTIFCPGCQRAEKPAKACKTCKLARAMDKAKDRLCERCSGLGGHSEGCTACKYLRENPGKKEPKPPKPLVDDNGYEVPEFLKAVFRVAADHKKAEALLNGVAFVFKRIEEGPARHAKPLDKEAHFEKFFAVFRRARWRTKMMRPSLVCQEPDCGEVPCRACRDKKWLTLEEAQAHNKLFSPRK